MEADKSELKWRSLHIFIIFSLSSLNSFVCSFKEHTKWRIRARDWLRCSATPVDSAKATTLFDSPPLDSCIFRLCWTSKASRSGQQQGQLVRIRKRKRLKRYEWRWNRRPVDRPWGPGRAQEGRRTQSRWSNRAVLR